MAWQDRLSRVVTADARQLIGASFRGVAFFVDSSDRAGGGRRVVRHEFPGRNEPEVDDMGAKAVTFSMTGYVVGEEYTIERDALITALEGIEGPGELVHPFYGRKRVICSGLSVRESIADGGMATFQISFTEVPLTPAPTEIPDFGGVVFEVAEGSHDASIEELEATFDVAGQPSFATASLATEFASVASAVGSALAPVVEATQEAARLDADVAIFVSNASALVRDPGDAIDQLLTTVRGLVETVEGSPEAVVNALIDAYGTPQTAAAVGTTATRDQERANQAALADALRRALIIEAASMMPTVEFETIEGALASRDTVVEALDTLLLTAGNTAFPQLVLLRASLIRAIPGDTELARIRDLEYRSELPSLLLSYLLYGDVDAEADILARNDIQHPGFISGAISVLSDA